jgi:SAM-dependent methyltransferase
METKQAGPFKGTMGSQQGQDPIYALGHSEEELQRLIDQSRFFGDMTEQVLINAGIGRGMRVLDVGCGAGDVSFLLAKLVGSSGSVIGVDRAAEAIATARSRAQAARLENVTFSQCEIADISLEHPVDAAVGRFVLMYIYDPITTLRRIAGNVKAGGVIAFQEMDLSGIRSLPHLRLFEQGIGWLTETFRRGRIETQMGLKLRQTFLGAGLPAPEMSMAARVEGGLHSPPTNWLRRPCNLAADDGAWESQALTSCDLKPSPNVCAMSQFLPAGDRLAQPCGAWAERLANRDFITTIYNQERT